MNCQMFMLIALLQILGCKRSRASLTWDLQQSHDDNFMYPEDVTVLWPKYYWRVLIQCLELFMDCCRKLRHKPFDIREFRH